MNITKHQVLKACLQKQEELIKNFESRVNVSAADAYNNNESASQSEDRTAGKIELLSTFNNELAFARTEINFLKSLNPAKQNKKVEPGAVVITNHLNFFIGVSSEKIEVGGEDVFGISTKAPIYSYMQDKEKGDSFKYNEKVYEIQEIY